MRIVLDDQHHQIAFGQNLAVVWNVLFASDRVDPNCVGFARFLDLAGWYFNFAGRRAGVVERQVKGERAALTVRADQADFTSQQRGQFAADRQPQSGAAILAAGARVGLLKGLENQALLLRRDADARVFDGERDDLLGLAEHRMIGGPARGGKADSDGHVAVGGELHGVGEQVLENLLQTLGVADHDARQIVGKFDVERQILVFGHVAEIAIDRVAQPGERNLLGIDGDGARLDLRQVENVVDQVQQIGARRVDVAGEIDLLARQVAAGVVGQLLAENQNRIERSAQFVRHVGQELGFVLRRQGQLGRLFFQRAAGLLHFRVLAFHFGVLLGQQLGLVGQLFVGLLEFALPRLQLDGQLLRLPKQVLRCASSFRWC